MTPDDFTAWLAYMRLRKIAMTDAEAARCLGVHTNTLSRWKQRGAPFYISLACTALIEKAPPWKAEHIFR